MDRPRGIGFSSTNATTKDAFKKTVSGYLGFLQQYIPSAAASIQSYSTLFRNGFLPFVVFLQQRKLGAAAIQRHTYTCTRVLHFLSARAGRQGQQYSPAKAQLRDLQLDYLKCLVQQLHLHAPPKPVLDIEQMKEDGEWVESEELVQFTHSMVSTALQHLADLRAGVQHDRDNGIELESNLWSDHICVQQAREVHDAMLCAFLFGYFPPVRISCMLSLQHPDHVSMNPSACLEAGCRRAACCGNRVAGTAGGGWRVQLYHHKTANKTKDPIEFPLPQQLEELMSVLSKHCWPLLTTNHTRNLFVNAKGLPFCYASFKAYYLALLNEEMPQVKFGPRRLRHVFVTNRLDKPEVAGPSNEAAALVMGNSVRHWKETYAVQYKAQQTAAAVRDTAAWAAAQLPPAKKGRPDSSSCVGDAIIKPPQPSPIDEGEVEQPPNKAPPPNPSSFLSDGRKVSWLSLRSQESDSMCSM